MPPTNVGMLFTPPLKDGKGVKAGVKEAARTLEGFYRRHVRLMSADLACRVARRLLKERGGSAVTVRLGWTPGDAAPLRVSRRTLRNRLRANVGGSLNKEFTNNY